VAQNLIDRSSPKLQEFRQLKGLVNLIYDFAIPQGTFVAWQPIFNEMDYNIAIPISKD